MNFNIFEKCAKLLNSHHMVRVEDDSTELHSYEFKGIKAFAFLFSCTNPASKEEMAVALESRFTICRRVIPAEIAESYEWREVREDDATDILPPSKRLVDAIAGAITRTAKYWKNPELNIRVELCDQNSESLLLSIGCYDIITGEVTAIVSHVFEATAPEYENVVFRIFTK